MHPKEDPPGVSVKEHLRVMFENSAWYPSRAVLLVGMALIAVSLVAVAQGRSLTGTLGNPVAAVLGVVGGVGYGLAGATFLFSDRLNFLFPAASAIALWSIVAGTRLLLRGRAKGLAARQA
jgi:hypothetical protein